MSTVKKDSRISVAEYLAGEIDSPVKHEYVSGSVHSMVGARNAHNLISTNALVVLGGSLRGKPCRPFNSDTKIRLRLASEVRFYYPDVSIICRQNPQKDTFQDEPSVILEVLSQQTRRIDEGEKKDAYLNVPSLMVYLLVEQETPAVVVWRRSERGFVREIYQGMDSVVPLPEIDTELPLSQLYDAVEFEVEVG
jgi:Uma2 family endonuclease